MNILIIADKKTSKEYSELLDATPNINVLGVVSRLNSIESIQGLKNKYSPLGLLVDTSVKHKGLDISLLVKHLQKTFTNSRILLFAMPEEIDLFNDFGLFAVIGNTITSIQFDDIIKAFINNDDIPDNVLSQEQTDRYIKRNIKTNTSLFNKKFIPLIFITLIFILLIMCLVLKNNNTVDNLSTPDEVITPATNSSTIPTEEKTTISSNPETFTSSTNYDASNNQVIVNTTTIPPPTVTTTTQTITTTQQPTTKKVVKKKNVNKPKTSNNSSVNNTPITQSVTTTNTKPKTQSQVKIDYGNNWSNNGKEDTKISISYLSKTLEVADSVSLSATVTPKKEKVHWSSSNTSVATVKQNGYVKAKSVGTAVITATANDKTATCTIYVKKRS